MNGETAFDDPQHLRRSAARASILEAGRRLVYRLGSEEVSLCAVAAEAGFGSSTVFGHFRNKDELVLAIVADDLGVLAAAMRSSLPAVEPEPAAILAPPICEEGSAAAP